MKSLKLHRSRVPNELFHQILADMRICERLYGDVDYISGQRAISRYIATAYIRTVALFGGALVINPQISTTGRIENRFLALGVYTALLVETEPGEALRGSEVRQIRAGVLDACVDMDWCNAKRNLWAPILAIVSNGASLEFTVFDSSSMELFTSGERICIPIFTGESREFRMAFVKCTIERLLDWFLMAFINGARAETAQSKVQPARPPRVPKPELPEAVIHKAEEAHWTLRKGDQAAEKWKWISAEHLAREGIQLISERLDGPISIFLFGLAKLFANARRLL
ncbi:hypothetical protein BJY00DRAFT_141943 [Aspergillus carlsbadensis]|nr:hypothetical protein BJY00DRAFT_141943 [Aspergillus carlsbadensis]